MFNKKTEYDNSRCK